MRAHWKVEDGMLVFDGKGRSLCTAKDYGDFEMFVDWKIEPKAATAASTSAAARRCRSGTPTKAGSGTRSAPAASTTTRRTPSKPPKVADKPVGEWNTFYIKMIGDKVTV